MNQLAAACVLAAYLRERPASAELPDPKKFFFFAERNIRAWESNAPGSIVKGNPMLEEVLGEEEVWFVIGKHDASWSEKKPYFTRDKITIAALLEPLQEKSVAVYVDANKTPLVYSNKHYFRVEAGAIERLSREQVQNTVSNVGELTVYK